jgi:hypothetical protein
LRSVASRSACGDGEVTEAMRIRGASAVKVTVGFFFSLLLLFAAESKRP